MQLKRNWTLLVRWAIAYCLLPIALLTSCTNTAVDNEGPVEVVQAFVAALEAQDASAIIDLLEPTEWRKEIGPELRSYLSHVDTIEMRDETYGVEEHSGETALVRVSGTLAYKLVEGEVGGERPVELVVETVRVDNTWYLRSLELPQPGS